MPTSIRRAALILAPLTLAAVAIVGALALGSSTSAQSANSSPPIPEFTESSGSISHVDYDTATITVTYPQPLRPCTPQYGCPAGQPPDIFQFGKVLVLNATADIVRQVTDLHDGDKLGMYFRASGLDREPYALLDRVLNNSGGISAIGISAGISTPGQAQPAPQINSVVQYLAQGGALPTRNLAAERQAIGVFKGAFKTAPRTTEDWRLVHLLAYPQLSQASTSPKPSP